MMAIPAYVFDAFALLAYLQDEPGKPVVERLLERLQRGDARISMATINLGEAYYRTVRMRDPEWATDMLARVDTLPA